MSAATLTGKDTIILDGRIFNDLANTDTCTLEFPNNLVESKAGKNGNVIYAFNASGRLVNVKLRVLKGSSDDKYLNSRLLEYINDPAGFILFQGEFIKRAGDGKGNISNDTYIMRGGVISKIPMAKENVEGDTEQSVSLYEFVFGNSERAIA